MQIKPISDLTNYNQVLEDVSVANPVYLTKNGQRKYVVLVKEEVQEIEETRAMLRLMLDLEQRKLSGESYGWLGH